MGCFGCTVSKSLEAAWADASEGLHETGGRRRGTRRSPTTTQPFGVEVASSSRDAGGPGRRTEAFRSILHRFEAEFRCALPSGGEGAADSIDIGSKWGVEGGRGADGPRSPIYILLES